MDTTVLLLYATCFCIVILIIWNIRNEIRFKKFFHGTNAKNLEGVLVDTLKEIVTLKDHDHEIVKHIHTIEAKLTKTVRNIEILRFNPFQEQGSNQSFAIALINDDGDGVVISSLYSRDHVSVFAKPINNGASVYELSKEEIEVLTKALGKKSKQ